jgi:hypothetical protein
LTSIAGSLVQTAIAQVANQNAWWDLYDGLLTDPDLARLEEISVWQYNRGLSLDRRRVLLNDDEW